MLEPLTTIQIPPFFPRTHCQAAIDLGLRCFVYRENVGTLNVVSATPKRRRVRGPERPKFIASHQDLATAYEMAWEQYRAWDRANEARR